MGLPSEKCQLSCPHCAEFTTPLNTAEDIDHEIEKLSKAQLRLKTHRNNVVPYISRLPPELLSRIFEIYVVQWHNDTDKSNVNSKKSYGWTEITRVCCLWREVALECPRLWTQIVISSEDRISRQVQILQRSKSCPLDVTISIPTIIPETPEIVHRCIGHMHHIRQLHVLGSPAFIQSIIPHLKIPSPVLRSLSFWNNSLHPLLIIPDSIFAGYTPSLRELTLVKYSLNPDAPMLRSLRHLGLCEQEVTNLSILSLLAILGSTPLIEHIGLHFKTIPKDTPPLALEQGPGIINIKSLRRLSISANMDIAIHILDRLSFPTTAHISLQTYVSLSDNYTHMSRLMSKSAASCNVACNGSLRSLAIRVTADYEYERSYASYRKVFFMGWSEPVPWGANGGSNPSERFSLTLGLPDPMQLGAIVNQASTAFPLKDLEVLFLSHVVDFAAETWMDFLSSEKIHTIEILRSVPHNLVRALSMSKETPIGSAQSSQAPYSSAADFQSHNLDLFLPALSTIVLRRVRFASDVHSKILETMLVRRKGRNGEIKRLELVECYDVSQELIQLLGSVTDLKWDSYT